MNVVLGIFRNQGVTPILNKKFNQMSARPEKGPNEKHEGAWQRDLQGAFSSFEQEMII